MTDLSVVEFGVYGFIELASLLMLIIMAVKEPPMKSKMAIARSIFLIPGMLCAALLASSGNHIDMQNVTTNIITKNFNATTNAKLTNSTTTSTVTSQITLQDRSWLMVHMLIFFVLLIYIVLQLLNLFIDYREANRAT